MLNMLNRMALVPSRMLYVGSSVHGHGAIVVVCVHDYVMRIHDDEVCDDVFCFTVNCK